MQARMNFFKREIVVHIDDIYHVLGHRDIASNALRTNRQFQVLRAVEARFDFGDDGAAVIVNRIQC